LIQPTEKEVLAWAGAYGRVPVWERLPQGEITAADVFKRLKAADSHCFILESAESGGARGRFTFLGYKPAMCVRCLNGRLEIERGGAVETSDGADPVSAIRAVLKKNNGPQAAGLPPYCGGLVGYFAFDAIKYIEPALRLDAEDRERLQDIDLMLFDRAVIFDHAAREVVVAVNMESGTKNIYGSAVKIISEIKADAFEGKAAEPPAFRLKTDLVTSADKPVFIDAVNRVKRYIYEGDIFQAVPSSCITAEAEGSLFEAYLALKRSNPSPYMYFFSGGDVEIAGASPETLVRLTDGLAETYPLAGSRPRGKTAEEDAALAADLLSDEKELAEHNMLVDLGRNDLGKISRFGTVKVREYKNILRFSHIMHIGSVVEGRVLDGLTGLDAIMAVLPAGTLSGAPKIRACEIINELEGTKRGLYGGALGYIAFSGNMDMCIAIRTAYMKNGRVFVRSGAGVVADSDPEREFEERAHKARAMINALKAAAERSGKP
jgi:anthranilate synthase component 1